MQPLQDYLKKRLADKGYLFVPYLALGDPDWDVSFRLVEALLAEGADSIELGLPFSDPTADGPVLQDAFARILQKPYDLEQLFTFLGRLNAAFPEQPFLVMGYSNIFYQAGFKSILARLAKHNVRGAIIPDLPYEEKQRLINLEGLEDSVGQVALVDFVTPTTTASRLRQICGEASGFLYMVSVKGVTGQSNFDLKPMEKLIVTARKHTDIPLLVGFGIREQQHARVACDMADGFIVGSRIHEIIAANEEHDSMVAQLRGEIAALLP